MEELVKRTDCWIFDCDGVLWKGEQAVPGVAKVLSLLRAKGKRLIFVSNNSAKTVEGYIEKFKKVLDFDIEAGEVVSSSIAAAFHLKRHVRSKLFFVGEAGVETELRKASVPIAKYSDYFDEKKQAKEPYSILNNDLGLRIVEDPEISDVLIGFDREFSFDKLAQAHHFIRYNKAAFYATNTDSTFPTGTILLPGTGTIVQGLSTSVSDITQPKVFGKPHQLIMEMIHEKYSFNKSRTCMVGDRLDTDITFGNTGGMSTLLVLSGVTSRESANNASGDKKPNLIAESLADLLPLLQEL